MTFQSHFLRFSFTISIFGLLFSGCNKEEGEGGDSTIKGRLVCRSYDKDYTVFQSESGDANEDVYIMYGDDLTAGDKVTTNPDGYFEFNYLQKGNYTIYYYSDDSTKVSTSQIAIKTNASISSNGKTVDLGKLISYKGLDLDEGSCTIKGYVELTNYKSDGESIKDISPAQEQEVYLFLQGHESDDIRVRTNFEGNFEFKNLLKGTYIIYAYSEDLNGDTEKIVVSQWVEITADNQLKVLPDIRINKL